MNARANTTPLSERKFLSLDEVANYLGIGRTSARKVTAEADCAVKFGRRTLYRKDKLDALVDRW